MRQNGKTRANINKFLISAAAVLLLSVFTDVQAQEVPGVYNNPLNQGTFRTDGGYEAPQNGFVKTKEVEALEERIMQLKRLGNPDQGGIIGIQRQLDALTRQSVTMQGGFYGGKIIPSGPSGQLLQSGNTSVFSRNNIKSIATVTEYTGTPPGKIWAVVGYEGTGSASTPDTIAVLYSADNGLSWTPYAHIALSGTDKLNYGEIDAEMLDGSTNKYLYLLFGARATGGTGKWFTAGASIRLTGTFAANLWTLTWPGDDATKRYYCPRLVSDVSTWPSAPWIYIAVSFDSAGTTGRVNTQKYAQINSPHTITPSIIYKTGKIYWVSNTETEQNLYTDIAYFQNGFPDSTIISFCGVPDSTKVFFSKMSGNGQISPSVSGQYIGPIGGSEPNYIKYGGRLSSNGNNNGSVFFVFNQKNPASDGVKYFRTTNFGYFNSMNQSVIWTSPDGVSLPDITGVRNGSTHRLGFVFRGAVDSLKYLSVSADGTFLTNSSRMNFIPALSESYAPAVGMRFAAGDSCFVLYSNLSDSELWSAQGCSGIITSIKGTETPAEYSLSQNYPNPFNPVTKISYSIPLAGFVTLKVFDVTGREAAVLVNGYKPAGSYIVDFNSATLNSGVYFYQLRSGEFVTTRKMTVVK